MRPFLIYILLCIIILSRLNAQINLDSIKYTISNANSDSIKLRGYANLCHNFSGINDDLSLRYADTILIIIAKHEEDNGKFYQLQKSFAFDKIGAVLFQKGKYNEALEYCKKSLKINEKLSNKSRIAVSLGGIGALLKTIGNKEALNYYLQSVKMQTEVYNEDPNEGSKNVLATTYHNLGATYAYFYYTDSAMYCFKKALSLLDTLVPQLDLALVYTGIAQAYKMNESYKNAIVTEEKALKIYKELGSPDGIVTVYNGFADIYLDAKEYKKAIEYSELAEKSALENGFTDDILYSYETRFLAFEKLGDLKNENLFLKKYAQLKDSISKQNHEFQIQELKMQYETEKKEKAIIELKKDNEIKALQNNRLMIGVFSIIVVMLLLIWLTVFLQRTIKERKVAYIKLQQKNIEIQSQGELLSEQSKLISKYQSQMNPHFIYNALNSLQGFVINDQKQMTIDQLQLFSKLMRQTLNNSDEDEISLDKETEYLRTYVEFEKNKFKVPIKFAVNLPQEEDSILIPPMMIQPFIENCIKHAGLNNIDDPTIILTITEVNELLKVVIKDNGSGFAMNNEIIFKRSHAVSMIRSRLNILFSREGIEFKSNYFEMRSKPLLTNGTEVIFYLPLKYKY